MSRSLVLDLPADHAEVLGRVADRLRITPAATAAILIGEALVHDRFPWVEFRDSVLGRQAYVFASSLALWEVIMIAEHYGLDPAATADHFGWDQSRVECILAYARVPGRHPGRATGESIADGREVARHVPAARVG